MPYNPQFHHRKNLRIQDYDYSHEGLYFITICVQDRLCLFGEIIDGEMMLNNAGKLVEKEWLKLPQRFVNIKLHEFVVMPNHFHAIIEIVGAPLVVPQNQMVVKNIVSGQGDLGQHDTGQPFDRGQPQGIAPAGDVPKPKTVGHMLGAFQSIVSVEYIRGVKNLGWEPFNGKLWQRNYWEHIIRNKQSYENITQYIKNNPVNWGIDKLFKK